jgi:hypothetical protein
MNPFDLNARRGLIILCGVLLAIGMLLMPPWQDWLIPPFGSGEVFGGYSPVFWPPHNPWTFPPLAEGPFWNSQHEYRVHWTLLLFQELAVGLTAAALFALLGRSRVGMASSHTAGTAVPPFQSFVPPFQSLVGACLGGTGVLAIGLVGVMAVMAPLLEAVPQGRAWATLLVLAGYLAAVLAGCWIGARLGIARAARLLAGPAAAQFVVAYVVFVLLPDASPVSHRLILVVWGFATVCGFAAGIVWAKQTSCARSATLQPVSGVVNTP